MSQVEEISAVGSRSTAEAAGRLQAAAGASKTAAVRESSASEPDDKVNLSAAAVNEIEGDNKFEFKVNPSTIDRSQDEGDTPLNPDGTRNNNPKLESPNFFKRAWEWIKNKYHEVKQKVTGFPGEILPLNNQTVQPLKNYSVQANYGPEIDGITHQPTFHNGVDLGAINGSAVRAVKDGNITVVGYNPEGYGNWVEIQHSDGTYTRYAHLSEFGDIKVGDTVGAGSVIGAMGSTGRSTKPHLHFELRDGDHNPMDPSSLLGITNPHPGGSQVVAETRDKQLNS